MVVLISVLTLAVLGVQTWRAGSFLALWLTPDQQGRLAWERRDFDGAAQRFQDPRWRGAAYYASGRYLDAAESFARNANAIGFYNRGNALMKGREYAQAIQAYELAVNEAPQWPEARKNLALARYVLDYIERSREESGTGGKLGADDYRFDASAERGETAVIDDRSAIEQQSTEKWMRAVNTETSEFLQMRFELEASRGDSG
jgi:Ca-activated chloride channel family protein